MDADTPLTKFVGGRRNHDRNRESDETGINVKGRCVNVRDLGSYNAAGGKRRRRSSLISCLE